MTASLQNSHIHFKFRVYFPFLHEYIFTLLFLYIFRNLLSSGLIGCKVWSTLYFSHMSPHQTTPKLHDSSYSSGHSIGKNIYIELHVQIHVCIVKSFYSQIRTHN